MTQTKSKPVEFYVEKIERQLRRKYPHLRLVVAKRGEGDVTIYYEPFDEEEEYPIIKAVSIIATDALIDGGYHIRVTPQD